jgi:phosphatidylinositol dimannoside acyltransferase
MTRADARSHAPTVGERVADAGFAVGWGAAQHVPAAIARRMAGTAAGVMWRRQGTSVLQLRANLARVLGSVTSDELDAVTQDALRRYLRYWQEAFQLPSWSTQRITSTFEVVEGLEQLDAAMDAGTGAMLALPHMGNWDHAGAWATLRYGGLSTVAERLRPESLFDRFVAYRESLGMEVIALGDSDVTSRLARRLKEGRLVCLLADRDLLGRGVEVDFFGEAASMPPGPAALSVLTGAPLMPVSTWHADGVTRARIHQVIESPAASRRGDVVEAMTQRLADAFAGAIADHPADWHMMQRLWHADLPTRGHAAADD